jgi:site-specific recombinase XerD
MPTERNQLIIRLLGDCGLRLDELTKLPTDCVIRSANRAYLRVHGKRDRVRDVPIPPQLLRRLLRHVAGRPANTSSSRLLLSLRRGPAGDYPALSPHGVEQVVKDAAARARITKRVYPHLMRHSWMTEMLRSGMNPLQLSVIAGASPQVIADHYAHLSKDDAFEAMMRAIAVSKKGRQ